MATLVSYTQLENELCLPVQDDEEEEEVVVKSKPTSVIRVVDNDDMIEDEEEPIVSLEDHIDGPPNGGLGGTSHPVPMLELAVPRQSRGDSSSLSPFVGWEGNAGGLSGQFKIKGKRCHLRLEDDALQWTFHNRKDNRNYVLSLADIFGVTAINSKGRPDLNGPVFVIHALRSIPGSCGKLIQVVCQPLDNDPSTISSTWVDHLTQLIQNFGHRPRRLYVVINPVSGDGSSLSTWSKVEDMFALAQVHTEILNTQRRFHAREVVQGLNLDQYDGIIVVGGDGTFNEVLNGLMLQTQQTAGVDLRRTRFVPVQPVIKLGIIPAGFSNSLAWSVLGTKNPLIATAQILLGCCSPIDICSIFNSGQLLLFSAGALSYGLQSEVSLFNQDFSWMGSHRINIAQFRAILSNRNFEGEINYIPVEEGYNREKCYSRCPKCSNFDGVVESPSGVNEKGACLMAATYFDRADHSQWKRVSGMFSSVIACPLTCKSHQAPQGMSPWAHQANGFLDLILVKRCSKFEMAKWFIKQRRTTQLDLPYVEVHRVKEFKFREILTPPSHCAEEEINLVNNEDEDETTNRRGGGGARLNRQQSEVQPASHWNIDGDDLNRVDIDVRVHRHLLMVFARGIEPLVEHELPNEDFVSNDLDVLDSS